MEASALLSKCRAAGPFAQVSLQQRGELKRGITLWDSTGYYSGADKKMLYVVVNRFEIAKLKMIIQELDPKAFVSIMEVSEIMGESKMYRKKEKKLAVVKRLEQLPLPVGKEVTSEMGNLPVVHREQETEVDEKTEEIVAE